MSNQPIVIQPQSATVPAWESKLDLVKKLIANECNNDELELFLYQARRTGLDPLARQIYAIKRQGKMVIQSAIDGLRLVADRTGSYAGNDDIEYGEVADAASPNGQTKLTCPGLATATVWKIVDGARCSFRATARWREYCPPNANNQDFMWRKMPFHMLGKCAEALALRKAFPAELSGIYIPEETEGPMDGMPAEQQIKRPERKKAETESKAEPKPRDPICITEKQEGMLYGIALKNVKLSEGELKAEAKRVCGVDHIRDIKKDDFQKMLEAIDPEAKFYTKPKTGGDSGKYDPSNF